MIVKCKSTIRVLRLIIFAVGSWVRVEIFMRNRRKMTVVEAGEIIMGMKSVHFISKPNKQLQKFTHRDWERDSWNTNTQLDHKAVPTKFNYDLMIHCVLLENRLNMMFFPFFPLFNMMCLRIFPCGNCGWVIYNMFYGRPK